MEKTKYDIFISYRRITGKNYARTIKPELEKRGYKVFLDFDELKDGVFDQRIKDAIKDSSVFLVILSEGALDRCVNEGDWVKEEILYANETKKHIVPVEVDKSFREIPPNLPESIKTILGAHQFSQIDTETLLQVSLDKMVDERIVPYIGRPAKNMGLTVGDSKGAEIHVETDADCDVFRFKELILSATVGEDYIIYMKPGMHSFTSVSKQYPDIKEKRDYEVPSVDYSGIFRIRLKEKIDNKLKEIEKEKAEKAEQKRLAELAEAQRLQREREKQKELRLRQAKEEERKRLQELLKQQRIAEEKQRQIEEERRKRIEKEKMQKTEVRADIFIAISFLLILVLSIVGGIICGFKYGVHTGLLLFFTTISLLLPTLYANKLNYKYVIPFLLLVYLSYISVSVWSIYTIEDFYAYKLHPIIYGRLYNIYQLFYSIIGLILLLICYFDKSNRRWLVLHFLLIVIPDLILYTFYTLDTGKWVPYVCVLGVWSLAFIISALHWGSSK